MTKRQKSVKGEELAADTGKREKIEKDISRPSTVDQP